MKRTLFTLLLFPAMLSAQTIVSTAPMNRTAVLEEFTAINCGNCPSGHTAAANLITQYGTDIAVIGVHGGGLANPSGSQPDFRTSDGASLWSAFSVFGQPTGTVNRGAVQGLSSWSGSVSSVLSQSSPVNIGASSSFDAQSGMLTVDVELYYTANSPAPNNAIYVSLTESNIIAYQQNYSSGASNTYNHMHVLRDMLTPPSGDPVTTTTMGTIVQRTFNVSVDPSWNMSNAHIVAFVGEDNGAVYQQVEIDAAGGISTGIQSDDELRFGRVYPNPVRDILFIPASAQSIELLELFDATGRLLISQRSGASISDATLSVAGLDAGNYLLRVNGIETQRVAISR